MPRTYSQILLHIVFSTKKRVPYITPLIAERLYPYMGGIIAHENGNLKEIGGIEDHVHLLIRWRTDQTIADLMRTVKSRTSKWIHDEFPTHSEFAWQDGYSVFSVSPSQENVVRNYIRNQPEHHKKESFQSELMRILSLHQIEFDANYLFE